MSDSLSREPQSLKSLLGTVAKNLGLEDKLHEATLNEIWVEVVGEAIAKNTKIIKFEDGRLYLGVASSTWRSELFIRRHKLITDINSKAGNELVKEIIFR
jgi:predicted nucleic acid-binding Zn ribbon protein